MGCSRDVSQAALGRTPCPAGSEPPGLVRESSLAVLDAHLARIHRLESLRWLPHQELPSPLVGTAGPRAWGARGPAPSVPPPTGGRRGDVPHQQQQVEVGCCKPSPVHSPPELTRRMREALPCTWPRLSLVPPQGTGGRPEGAAGPSEQPSHPPGSQAEKTSP